MLSSDTRQVKLFIILVLNRNGFSSIILGLAGLNPLFFLKLKLLESSIWKISCIIDGDSPIFFNLNISVISICKFLVCILTALSLSNNSLKVAFFYHYIPLGVISHLSYSSHYLIFWSNSYISMDNS